METLNAAELLAALGHEARLSIFRLLVEAGDGGLHPGVMGEQLGLAPATLSFHLAHLSRVGLIQGTKEGRFIRYATDYATMDRLIAFLTQNCCQGRSICLPQTCLNTAQQCENLPHTSDRKVSTMSSRVYNVLFLCTGNSARSILADAILNHTGRGRFRAFSAGSHPNGAVNPCALELLQHNGLSVEGLRSKSWDEFTGPEAPQLDFVFTVCDNAAGEVCPYFPGHPVSAHWGIEDPAAAEGSDEIKRQAMSKAFRLLHRRIALFTSLPLDKIDELSLKKQLHDIGQLSRQDD